MNPTPANWHTAGCFSIAVPGSIPFVSPSSQCGLHNASDNTLRFVKENFLADDSVHPVGKSLTMVSPDQRYSHVVTQRVQAANGKDYTVLFLLTGTGHCFQLEST